MSGPGTSEVSTYANITHSMSALKSCSCTPLLSWMAKEKHHSFLPAPFANIFANSMRVINLSAFFAVLFHKKSYDFFCAMFLFWRGEICFSTSLPTGRRRTRWEKRADPLAWFFRMPWAGPHHFGGWRLHRHRTGTRWEMPALAARSGWNWKDSKMVIFYEKEFVMSILFNTCSATHAQECVLIVVSLGFFHSFHQH